ncbi:MAG: hypothetical protein P4L46_18030 [Fimbriimonas sp.]|nr:hypothetical protein [Fimbriimonas sp.]
MVGLALAIYLASHGLASQSGTWVEISGDILTELAKNHVPSGDPYATATAGISVDRTNGDVYLLANNIGICKSVNQGKTFSLVSGDAVTGRFETGWGLNIDPGGRRLMAFTIYGSSAYSSDGGQTWTRSQLSHLDYGAVDWRDTGRTFLAIGHESGGKLERSADAGAHWTSPGTGYWGVGLWDRKTFFATREGSPGILRSEDGGQTWRQVSDAAVAAPVMEVFRGVCYWLGEHGLLVSRDRGRHWNLLANSPSGATLGPMFGRDAAHMVVGTPNGLFETVDDGRSWSAAAPLAPEIKVLRGGRYGTYGWDPIREIFYASQMRMPAYRFQVSN